VRALVGCDRDELEVLTNVGLERPAIHCNDYLHEIKQISAHCAHGTPKYYLTTMTSVHSRLSFSKSLKETKD
jgi:hypothetical protein